MIFTGLKSPSRKIALVSESVSFILPLIRSTCQSLYKILVLGKQFQKLIFRPYLQIFEFETKRYYASHQSIRTLVFQTGTEPMSGRHGALWCFAIGDIKPQGMVNAFTVRIGMLRQLKPAIIKLNILPFRLAINLPLKMFKMPQVSTIKKSNIPNPIGIISKT